MDLQAENKWIARSGPLLVDVRSRTITRDGTPVHLEPRAFLLLTILLRRAPDSVTTDELYEQIWGKDQVAQPQGLQTQVSNLRRKLGDADAQPYVLHVGGGYRWGLSVEWIGAGAPLWKSLLSGLRWKRALALAVGGLALVGLVLWMWPTSARVTITSPSNQEAVPQDCRIEGTTSVPDVMVIIESDRMFFVQPRPSVTGKKWSVTAYCGQEGDRGKQFFIRALGAPAKPLSPGPIGDSMPDAQAYSETVVVTRQ